MYREVFAEEASLTNAIENLDKEIEVTRRALKIVEELLIDKKRCLCIRRDDLMAKLGELRKKSK